jgi:hypothetical protein
MWAGKFERAWNKEWPRHPDEAVLTGTPHDASIAGKAVTRIVDPTAESDWDGKLLQFSGCTVFHSSAWARVLKESYGLRAGYILAEQGGTLCGVLPLMEADNWPKGRRGVSLPFTDECATLARESRFHKELVAVAKEEGGRRGWKYLELRGCPGLSQEVQPSLSFYGHDLDVEPDERQMFKRLDDSVQRAIRKATREGLKVEIATHLDAVQTFYGLHVRTRRKHGVPPQSIDFFESIHRHVLESGQGFVVIARRVGKAIAAAVFFHFGGKAIYKFGASDDRFREFRGNNLVMWEGIRCLAKQGVGSLNFGRTVLANEGLRRFKLSWGASESRISYCKYDFKRGGFVKDRDRAWGWQTRVFQLLPTAIFRRAGALLYPRLA